jgi:hypothetical protein
MAKAQGWAAQRARLKEAGASEQALDKIHAAAGRLAEGRGHLPADHAHIFSLEQDGSDAFSLRLAAAKRALEVVARLDPYVRPVAAEGGLRLSLFVPGGPQAIGLSAAEHRAATLALGVTNGLIARGELALDSLGRLSALGADANPAILASVTTVHWWGICNCLTEDEVNLITMVAFAIGIGLMIASAIDFLTTMIPGIAVVGGGTLLEIISMTGKLLGHGGVCIYTTPFGQYIVPWI